MNELTDKEMLRVCYDAVKAYRRNNNLIFAIEDLGDTHQDVPMEILKSMIYAIDAYVDITTDA